MKRNKVVVLALALVLVMLLGACNVNQPGAVVTNPYPGTAAADTVTIDIMGEPAELNSLFAQDGTSANVLLLCMAGIARLDENDQPQPDLAERWEISEDGLTYTVYLRKDAMWSNGDPVTAHDYYYSYVTQLTKANGAANGVFLADHVKNGQAFYDGTAGAEQLGITVVDDYTLKMEWEQTIIGYGPSLFTFPGFMPMNQKAHEAIGPEQYAKDADKLVYTGPYAITQWVHNDHILLERNPNYKGTAEVNIPKVKLVMITDNNTRLNAFRAGELDVCNLYGDQIGQLEAEGEGIVQSYVDGNTWFLAFNAQDEIFSNANLRKALSYSLDIQSLLDYVIKDGSVVADALVPGTIAGVDGSFSQARGSLFAYDLEGAKGYLAAALQELGLSIEELNLEMLSSDTTYGQTQSAYMQEQWREGLGLEVSIRTLPWKARVEAQYSGDFDMIATGWGPTFNDATTFLGLFASEQVNNPSLYANLEYNRLLGAAEGEADLVKRQALLIEAERLLIDDMAIGPMYFTCSAYATSAKIENLLRTSFQPFDVCDGAKIAAGG